MKLCASCGAGLPDGAAFCNICGSKEFKEAVMPDFNAPQEEKPKIEYDQYGRPIGQQYEQPQYEQPHFTEDYTDPYNQGYSDQSVQPPYLDDYAQQYQQQYAAQQYQQQYSQQYQQQYAQQYPQQQYPPQYDQQYAQQYASQQYPHQYEQPQVQQYPQQYAQQYEQPQPQQYAQQYEQPQPQQYAQQYEQPQPQQYAQPASDPEPVTEPEPVVQPEPPKAEPAPPPAPSVPEFDSKNFVFEKKEEEEEDGDGKKKAMPKNFKEFIAELRNTRDFTNNYNNQDFLAHKKECIFAALGITFWVPYVFSKDCNSSRFYANQGFLTFIIELIFVAIYSIFANIISIGFVENTFDGYRLNFFGWIVGFIVTVVVFAIPAFIVVTSIMNIREGKIKEIPFIGRLRIIP